LSDRRISKSMQPKEGSPPFEYRHVFTVDEIHAKKTYEIQRWMQKSKQRRI
jgi:hypothetical protein